MAKRIISGPPLFPESWVELDAEVAAAEAAAAAAAAASAAAETAAIAVGAGGELSVAAP